MVDAQVYVEKGSTMTWFEVLTGCPEDSPEQVRRQLKIDGTQLHSLANGKAWTCGELEILSLGQLRERLRHVDPPVRPLRVREVVANVQHLHTDPENDQALFQVASQFNLLEMTSPGVTPECGVGIYENDFTQGPACAMAAGAGTIFRNYFAVVNGRVGQTMDNQIDCLAGVGAKLGNANGRLWRMVNGYALPSPDGLIQINRQLESMNAAQLGELRQALQVGIQWCTQVTIANAPQHVSQIYCSAMPVTYTRHAPDLWAPLARLILEAAYEATLCAAVINRARTGCQQLFLTLLGGGAFGNNPDWIFHAIRRALDMFSDSGLDVAVVSYGASNNGVRRLVKGYE